MSISHASVMPVLAVDDLERATSFYHDTLGLEVRRSEQDPSGAMVDIGDGHIYLYQTTFRRGENTVASINVEDVPGIVRDLRGRGVSFEEYDLPGLKTEDGVATMGELQSAWFKDSEGNTLAITTDLEAHARKAA